MTYFVTLYILLINIFNTIAKSKRLVLLSATILMAFLFGGIYNCSDDIMYQYLYDSIRVSGLPTFARTEVGFTFLAFLCTKIGLTYRFFRTLIAFIGLLLIQKTAFEYTRKFSLVFLLYFIYPFMLDVIQIRNFLAASIVIYSMTFLVQNSKKGDVYYVIGIALATSIHYMSLFFIPFLFANKLTVRRLLTLTLIITPLLCVLTSTPIIPNLVRSIVGEGFMHNIEGYFRRANWGFILLWTRQLAISMLAYLCYIYLQKSDIGEKWKIFGTIVLKLNIYLVIICFPMLMFNGNYFRLLRPVLFLNYILISQSLYLNARKGLVFSLLAVFIVFSYWVMDVLTSNFGSVLAPFFQSNSYF
jgi:hypothetical protein